MDAQTLLSRVGDTLSVRRAFGDPIDRNGFLVIPVALVAGGGGGGEGQMAPSSTDARPASDAEVASKNGASSPPIGSGGGLGGAIVPLGVYVVRGDKVIWKPVVQPMLLALVALSVVRLLAKHVLK